VPSNGITRVRGVCRGEPYDVKDVLEMGEVGNRMTGMEWKPLIVSRNSKSRHWRRRIRRIAESPNESRQAT